LLVEGWELDALAPSLPRWEEPAGAVEPLSADGGRAAAVYAAYAAGVHAEADGDAEKAAVWYDRACEAAAGSDLDDEEPLQRAIAMRLASRRFGEVAERMEAHYRVHPDRPAVAAWLVQFYLAAEEEARAREIAEAGVRDHPGTGDFWSILAAVQGATGDPDAAVSTLERGIGRLGKDAAGEKTLLRLQLAGFLAPDGRVPEEGASRKRLRENLRALREEAAPPEEAPEAGYSPEDAEELYVKLLVADGDLAEAVAVASEIEARKPRNLGEKTRLAYLLSAAGAKAEELKSLAEGKKTPEAARAAAAAYAGVLLAKAGKPEEALPLFRAALAARPGDIACWIHAASAAVAAGDRAAAEALFAEAEAANPQSAALREGRGRMLADAGDHAAACRAYAEAAELARANGTFPEPGAEEEEGEYDGELTLAFPFNHACALVRAGDGKAAGGWLVRAGESARRFLAVVAAEGAEMDAAARAAFYEAASEACGAAAETHPLDEDEYLFARGFFFGALGRPRKSLDALAAAEEAAANLPTGMGGVTGRDTFHYLRALALLQLGRNRQAEEPLQRCLDLNPDHASALNTLAYLRACRGKELDRALRYIRRALEQEPDNPAFLDTLAWALHKMGRNQEALKEIRKAKKALPCDPEIREHWRAIRAACKAEKAEAEAAREAEAEEAPETPESAE